MIRIDSIQIGKVITEGVPGSDDPDQREWTSAFRKSPVDGPVELRDNRIVGDEFANKTGHGTPDKAILCYPSGHYAAWNEEHPEIHFSGGGFGENLTLAGVTENEVCIGDRWKTAECEFEVSQPRQPCWKISRRWQCHSLLKEVTQSGRTGWYLRILTAGRLEQGETIELIARPNPQWSIARANAVMFNRKSDPVAIDELMNLQELSPEWKKSLA